MAYGVDAAFGLRPMQERGGSSWDNITPYPIASGQLGNIFTGDLVAIKPSGTATTGTGYITKFDPSKAVNPIVDTSGLAIGVFIGCQYLVPMGTNPTNPFQMNPMWVGGTGTYGGQDAIGYVIDDPRTIFNIQANNPSGTPLTQAVIGSVANIVDAGGDTSTSQSGMKLDYATISSVVNAAGGSLFPLKIVGVVQVPGNILSSGNIIGIPFVNLKVSLNNSVYSAGQFGV